MGTAILPGKHLESEKMRYSFQFFELFLKCNPNYSSSDIPVNQCRFTSHSHMQKLLHTSTTVQHVKNGTVFFVSHDFTFLQCVHSSFILRHHLTVCSRRMSLFFGLLCRVFPRGYYALISQHQHQPVRSSFCYICGVTCGVWDGVMWR